MKRTLAILALVSALAPLTAHAEDARMSDARYIAASRCLAYAELPQLQADGADFTRLRAASTIGHRSRDIVSQAADEARRTRITAHSWGDSDRSVTQLRERRDDACAGFVHSGLVQLQTATPSS
jgi:hypothetical protein